LDASLRWHDNLFLLLWILLPLLFFSISHSKLVPYIFPIFPPLAILLGRHLAKRWENASGRKLIIILAAIAATLDIAANYAVGIFDRSSIKPLANIVSERAGK